MQRIRIKYAKTEAIKFLSHKNIMRAIERAVRRAELPIAYSQGFNPHMRIAYGKPIKVGAISDSEYADLYFDKPVTEEKVKEKLDQELPPGLKLLDTEMIDVAAPSIQETQ